MKAETVVQKDNRAMVDAAESVPLGPVAVNQLRWRCRRGLLENDLFIERFFARHEHSLTEGQAKGLMALMDLPDNDLLDLLLRRREPVDELATAEVQEVLVLLRTPA